MIRKALIIISTIVVITCVGATISGVYTERVKQYETIEKIQKTYESESKITTVDKYKLYQEAENYEYRSDTRLFIYGYLSLQDNRLQSAKEYFKAGIHEEKCYTHPFIKFYNYKFLIETLVKEKEYTEALEYLEEVFEKFNRIQYNNEYKEVWDILLTIIEIPDSTNIMIQYVEGILNQHELGREAKSYYISKLVPLYILDTDYLKAIEGVVELLSIEYYSDEDYYRGRALVNLAIVCKGLDANEIALKILENINTNIEDTIKKAHLEVYRLINLAQINTAMEKYDEALRVLEEIELYKEYLPEDKRKEVEVSKLIKEAYIYVSQGDSTMAKQILKQIDIQDVWGEIGGYQTLQSEYMRVLGEVYMVEGAYTEAQLIYEEIITGQIRGVGYEDYRNALDKLYIIYLNKGQSGLAEEIKEEQQRLKSVWKNKLVEMEIRYVSNKKQVEEARTYNESVRIKNYVYLAVLGIASFFIIKQSILPWWQITYLKKKVRKFIDNKNYFLVFQLIVNPKTNHIIGLEALLRLNENGKIVYPNIFISQIKQAGMIGEIALWEIREIDRIYDQIQQIKGIDKEVYLSINISLNEVMNRRFIDDLKKESKLLLRRGAKICLEITEDVGLINEVEIKNNITELIEYGFKIAIDDFGVEYSNIALLDQFDFHVLKLDKHFIENIAESVVVQNLMKVINELSMALDISIVVEGVEEEWQKECIKSYSSDTFYIQGYYYSKPLELEQLKQYRISD